jgi:Tfp pilus assembly protein PilV
MKKKINKKGFGLLEIVIGVAIISVTLFSLSAVAHITLKVSRESVRKSQAAFLMEEGMEAMKLMRDAGWSANISTLTAGTNYYLYLDAGTAWKSTATPAVIDGIFTRIVRLDNVYRDANNDIAATGTLDSNIKKITVSVSWANRGVTTTKNMIGYIANLFKN